VSNVGLRTVLVNRFPILTLVLRFLQGRQADEVRTPDLTLGWRDWVDSASGMGLSVAGFSVGRSAIMFLQLSRGLELQRSYKACPTVRIAARYFKIV